MKYLPKRNDAIKYTMDFINWERSKQMKTIRTIVSVFVACFVVFCLFSTYSAEAATYKGFNFKPGDIVITKNTSSRGVTGHAGIVASDGKNIVHSHPSYNKGKPHKMSISTWLTKYPKTKVVRSNSSTIANKAGKYAYNSYIVGTYKNQSYKVTSNPKDRTYLYCSELVWQSYYYGANSTFYTFTVKPYKKVIPDIIEPYGYLNPSLQKLNGYKTVKTFSW
ncbi:hypothetical protein AC623_07240 [Bacillus sp. FJAT-27231]|nr:hypothetical protein AC623_07240 [Bacillus sp. FJAT-27231]